jgi:hypothetical protein
MNPRIRKSFMHPVPAPVSIIEQQSANYQETLTTVSSIFCKPQTNVGDPDPGAGALFDPGIRNPE